MTESSRIPLLDLAFQNQPLEPEIMAAITRVVRSGQFIMGSEVHQFEEDVAQYCGVPHAIGVSSGTDALLVALMALDIKPGERIITTTFSFFATAGVIARLGAQPVFADIEPGTFNLDLQALENAWEKLKPNEQSQVRAIIPVHLFGQCADLAPTLEFAAHHDLVVIEDAAQALGAEYAGTGDPRQAGTLGEMGCFSFFPSKNLGAFGDAGLVVTSDAALAERLRVLRLHGAKPKYFHKSVGGNFRLDTVQAAVLSVKLKHLNQWHRKRRENAARYGTLFESRGLKEFLTLPISAYEDQGLQFPHIYNQYVIRCQQRDELQQHLLAAGISTAIYYPVPLHLQECFALSGYREGDLPESEKAAGKVLALPIYPGLTPEQQEYIVSAIERFYRRS